jgi:release factor glutamine methyltransferase
MRAAIAHERVNVGTLRRSIVERLRRHGLESAELDARVLLAHALGVEPSTVIACANETVSARAFDLVESLVSRRLAGEPAARIVGRKEFWSRNFVLGPDALVPRPETETVVEAALAAFPDRNAELRVLDLGTGSGALLAAILLERPYVRGIGIDRNARALAVARTNFAAFGLSPRASVICADWAAPLGAKFDLVVANPPYVPTHELARLPLEVRDHDPMLALNGGARGLSAYDAIVADLPRVLAAGGVAVLELGQGQEAAVAEMARAYRLVVDGPARRDLSGRARALVLRSGG